MTRTLRWLQVSGGRSDNLRLVELNIMKDSNAIIAWVYKTKFLKSVQTGRIEHVSIANIFFRQFLLLHNKNY